MAAVGFCCRKGGLRFTRTATSGNEVVMWSRVRDTWQIWACTQVRTMILCKRDGNIRI